MGYPSTPPDPPEFGKHPACPNCGDAEWAHVAMDCTWEDSGEGYDEIDQVLWECDVCHEQYWSPFERMG
jgi:hypothetical protein